MAGLLVYWKIYRKYVYCYFCYLIKCLSIGSLVHLKPLIFPFVSNGKLMSFRSTNSIKATTEFLLNVHYDPHLKRLAETVQMWGHNICFH